MSNKKHNEDNTLKKLRREIKMLECRLSKLEKTLVDTANENHFPVDDDVERDIVEKMIKRYEENKSREN